MNLLIWQLVAPFWPAGGGGTHHVDEIPPGFTHALLLASGRIEAAGPVAQVLTRDRLSACFGLALNVEHRRGRWRAWATGVADPL